MTLTALLSTPRKTFFFFFPIHALILWRRGQIVYFGLTCNRSKVYTEVGRGGRWWKVPKVGCNQRRFVLSPIEISFSSFNIGRRGRELRLHSTGNRSWAFWVVQFVHRFNSTKSAVEVRVSNFETRRICLTYRDVPAMYEATDSVTFYNHNEPQNV